MVLGLHSARNVWRAKCYAERAATMTVPWLPPTPHDVNDAEVLWKRFRDGILHLTDMFAQELATDSEHWGHHGLNYDD
ncbi:unnamed protein product [Echinostoma caproni]|uniref:DDE_3 domain-containing protein n=1 Tax=Echinostoma caproni TaxID=27848 RepID=A0A183AZS1_9TREM|nr:unnamed protein product [Echinostoma caproni]